MAHILKSNCFGEQLNSPLAIILIVVESDDLQCLRKCVWRFVPCNGHCFTIKLGTFIVVKNCDFMMKEYCFLNMSGADILCKSNAIHVRGHGDP
jgi:hypothetical protein